MDKKLGFDPKTLDVERMQDSGVRSQKILRDGQIYILRGDKMYTIMGQER